MEHHVDWTRKFLPSHNNQNIKYTKQERILKTVRERGHVTYKGKPIRITADFSPETMKARRSWTDVIQTLREHKWQPRLLYPAIISITIDGETKVFYDKTKFSLRQKFGLSRHCPIWGSIP